MTVLSPLRVGRITGSRVPAILGISPYNDRESVLREMVREHRGAETEFSGNIATEWGTTHEADAIAEYEQRTVAMVHSAQEIVVHPLVDWLAVTPDGLVGDDGMVEAKCPYRALYSHIDERPDYQAQIQLQLECTGRDWCDFVVWRPTVVNVSRLYRDPSWLPSVRPVLDEFMAEFATVIESDELSASHLAPLVDQRADEDWLLAASDWLEAKRAVEQAEALADQARRRLIELAESDSERGGGVIVSRATRKGSIDYSKVVKEHLAGVDLEPYRKATSTVSSVRRSAA